MEKLPSPNGDAHTEQPVEQPTVRSLVKGVSEALEERAFTADEIYTYIENLDGLQRKDFTSIEHTLNSAGVLVVISFKLKDAIAKEKFKRPTSYTFLLKVTRGHRSASTATKIERFYLDDKGGIDFANPIAEYINGAWARKD